MGRHWVRFETSLQSWVQATGRYNAGARHATSCTRKLAASITNLGADSVIPYDTHSYRSALAQKYLAST
jgi:hypothetical protein